MLQGGGSQKWSITSYDRGQPPRSLFDSLFKWCPGGQPWEFLTLYRPSQQSSFGRNRMRRALRHRCRCNGMCESNSSEKVSARTFKLGHNGDLDSNYILTRDDFTSYFQSAIGVPDTDGIAYSLS